MTSYEFIQELEDALRGQVSPQVIEYNVNYYREYIREQLASGKTQSEVFELLGSPRMIAKTIINSESAKENDKTIYNSGKNYQEKSSFHFTLQDILYGKWYYKVIAIIAVIFVLYLVFALLFTAVKILFWPAIIVFVAYFIWTQIKNKSGN